MFVNQASDSIAKVIDVIFIDDLQPIFSFFTSLDQSNHHFRNKKKPRWP